MKIAFKRKLFKPKLLWLWLLFPMALLWFVWIFWSEANPEQERELRLNVHEWLAEHFPDEMALEDGWHGLLMRHDMEVPELPTVILVHGLDEPGDIWDELLPTLSRAGYPVMELRYPNDHAINFSAAYFASLWHKVDQRRPAILIGHSMGGLVIREFVSTWRHPVGESPRVDGAVVQGVILVGTPNHGSDLARMRAFLEVKNYLVATDEYRRELFARFRDGTGAAKIDLRPDSQFLAQLNQRPWPDAVNMQIIAGLLIDNDNLDLIGDGAVPLSSALMPDLVAEPFIVQASHRGLLIQTFLEEQETPAIPIIGEILEAWTGVGFNGH